MDALAVGSFPLLVQERLLLEDLLSCLTGFSGKHLRMHVRESSQQIVFETDQSLDLSLRDLVSRMTPIAAGYVCISDYIAEHSRPEYGLVQHAFCAALRQYLHLHLLNITQLETQHTSGQLTLQKAWFFLHPSMRTITVLHALVTDVLSPSHVNDVSSSHPRGGALINLIYEKSQAVGGDEGARKIFDFLLEKTTKPFLSMLGVWIYTGQLDDLYSEFMVEEAPYRHWHDDTYWQKRYTLRDDKIPVFLGGAVADMILTTGKYLNVIRECGLHVTCPHTSSITYTANDRIYAQQVDDAYRFASAQLLNLVMVEKRLASHLKTLKRYFLVESGDWLVHFMDGGREELTKHTRDTQVSKLESMLDHAIRASSITGTDDFRDLVGCELRGDSALEEVLHVITIDGTADGGQSAHRPRPKLTGMEAFTLSYAAEWPLSIVLSNKTITKYRWMFRHLLLYRHVEQRLCDAWSSHQSAKGVDVHAAFMGPYVLRRRMMQLVHSLRHYLVYHVIEANWEEFVAKMTTAKTIDEVIERHEHFLDMCIKQFMLNDVDLITSLARLMNHCLRFADYVDDSTRSFDLRPDPSLIDPNIPPGERRKKYKTRTKVIRENANATAMNEHHKKTIHLREEEFDKELKVLIVKLTNSRADANAEALLYSLDFNNYYLPKKTPAAAQ